MSDETLKPEPWPYATSKRTVEQCREDTTPRKGTGIPFDVGFGGRLREDSANLCQPVEPVGDVSGNWKPYDEWQDENGNYATLEDATQSVLDDARAEAQGQALLDAACSVRAGSVTPQDRRLDRIEKKIDTLGHAIVIGALIALLWMLLP